MASSSFALLVVLLLGLSPIIVQPGSVMADPPFSANVMVNETASTGNSSGPTVIVGLDGRLFAAWSDGRAGPADYRIYFASSLDGGATWTTPNVRLGDDLAGSYQQSPSIAVNSTGVLFATWSDSRNDNGDIYFARSQDGGVTWSTPNVRVNKDIGAAPQHMPRIAVDDGTNIFVTWTDERGGQQDIYVGKSSDGGMTWTETEIIVESANYGQWMSSVAVDSAGDVWVVWSDSRNGNSNIYAAKSTDGGLSWSNPNIRITSVPAEQHQPAIASDLSRTIYVAWHDYRNGEPDVYLTSSTDGGGTWMSPYVRVSTESESDFQMGPSVAVDPVGVVHLAWMDERGGQDIYVSSSFDMGVTWTSPNLRVNDDPGTAAQYAPSLAAGGPGRVYVIWADGRGGDFDIYFSAADVPKPPPFGPTEVHAALVGASGDVRLVWTPSSPEAWTDHYEVWRGDVYSGTGQGYSVIPAAADLPPGTSTFTDDTTVSGQSHYYAVHAVGPGGRKGGDFQAAKLVRQLPMGMSLLGYPLLLEDTSVAAGFQPGVLDVVRKYDAGDPSDPWKSFRPTQAAREFENVDLLHGFWINSTAGGEWRIAGRVPRTVVISLRQGWNLVSYSSTVPRTVDLAFSSLTITRAELFDPLASPYFLRVAAPSDLLVPGSGLWVFSDLDQDWNLSN